MSRALLITQCLQNDFVQPLQRFEPLPNTLHIGYHEAQRLLGPDPAQGPIAHVMRWARAQSAEDLAMIHIRDWHDPEDPAQRSHLEHFGRHCVRDTAGAGFVFDALVPPKRAEGPAERVVDATTLNDFDGTTLAQELTPFANTPLPVGMVGVWTEAKITFLAYELATRYPHLQLGVCSALAASSSRAAHFLALDQLQKLLGVQVFTSVGAFLRFLGGEPSTVQLPASGLGPQLDIAGDAPLESDDRTLLRYLFRDSRKVKLRVFGGGYSGNLVLGSESESLEGMVQVPHVVKMGPQAAIGQERARFERVESVLGNAAPSIVGFADVGERGAIKYRYAAMAGGASSTFQKQLMGGRSLDDIRRILDRVFGDLLGRFYAGKTMESVDLLDLYVFASRYAGGVNERVAALVGKGSEREVEVLPGWRAPHPGVFYAEQLDGLPRDHRDGCYVSYVHGDLNGANIIIDQADNVWLIDFFHTDRSHVLKDLIKLENDLLYIFTPMESDAVLEEALGLSDVLLGVTDLAAPLPDPAALGLRDPGLVRTWEVLRHLRSFYPALVEDDRDPLQALIGQMRYAVHTLSFYESNEWHKRWALYTAGHASARIVEAYRRRRVNAS